MKLSCNKNMSVFSIDYCHVLRMKNNEKLTVQFICKKYQYKLFILQIEFILERFCEVITKGIVY